MTLKLYNTLTRKKEDFVPLDPANVRMYVCGPTVYDYAHIGNARPVIVFDVLFRLLRHLYGADHVTYVRNITDVDDKINKRAAEEGVSIRDLTEKTAAQFHADIAALGVLPPTFEPRATEHIDGMIRMIEALIGNGHAYAAEGHVLFDVASDPHYGCLSGRSQDEMIAGARVEVAPYKRNPMDFVLWKPSSDDLPGWDSPWGRGRPGWHIECSVMSDEFLGGPGHQPFDIHGGGHDLIFPHHENEIAQSTCALGNKAMANYWLHNGFLQVEGEKMSKSLGNFITIHQLLDTEDFGGRRWPGQVLRLAMLMTHYRQPIDFTNERLSEANRLLREWSSHIALNFETLGYLTSYELNLSEVKKRNEPSAEVIQSLLDDLNFANIMTHLHDLRIEMMRHNASAAVQMFRDLEFLGFLDDRSLLIFSLGIDADLDTAQKFESELHSLRVAELNNDVFAVKSIIVGLESKGATATRLAEGCWKVRCGEEGAGTFESRIEALIAARLAARAAKNWKEADRIRDELAAQGITLKDGKDPATGQVVTTWEVAR